MKHLCPFYKQGTEAKSRDVPRPGRHGRSVVGRWPGPAVPQPAPVLPPLPGRREAMPSLGASLGDGSVLGLGLSCCILAALPGSGGAGKGGAEAALALPQQPPRRCPSWRVPSRSQAAGRTRWGSPGAAGGQRLCTPPHAGSQLFTPLHHKA